MNFENKIFIIIKKQMVSRKEGILSDSHYYKNCIEYLPLPMGFANAKYRGNMITSDFPGIRTPKYQRSAPKPQTADTLASSLAKYMTGNKAENTRMVLDELHRQARAFKVPEVSLEKKNRSVTDQAETSILFSDLARAGLNRGDVLTTKSIASQRILTENDRKYINIFAQTNRITQNMMMNRFIYALDQSGIDFQAYNLSKSVMRGKASEGKSAKLSDRMLQLKSGLNALNAIGSTNVDLSMIFSQVSKEISEEEGEEEESSSTDSDQKSEPKFEFTEGSASGPP